MQPYLEGSYDLRGGDQMSLQELLQETGTVCRNESVSNLSAQQQVVFPEEIAKRLCG